MKAAVIIYHKNLLNIYKQEWIDKSLASIRNQSFQNFDVYELCYSDQPEQLWAGSRYWHLPMDNHISALNFIIDQAIRTAYDNNGGADVIFNVNLDDHYSFDRFELQMQAIKAGHEAVSSNFQYISDINGEDKLGQKMEFHNADFKTEAARNHNIICHPVMAFTRKFWIENRYYNTDELGYEDMTLWKRAYNNGFHIHIIDKILCYYRISDKQTGRLYPVYQDRPAH